MLGSFNMFTHNEAMIQNPIEEAIKRIVDITNPRHEVVLTTNSIEQSKNGLGYDFVAMVKSLNEDNDEVLYICADFTATFTKHGLVLQHKQNQTTNIGITDFALEVPVEDSDISQKVSQTNFTKEQANCFNFKAHFLALKELIMKYDSSKYCYSY